MEKEYKIKTSQNNYYISIVSEPDSYLLFSKPCSFL